MPSAKRSPAVVLPRSTFDVPFSRFKPNRITAALLVSMGAAPTWAASFDVGSNNITLHNGTFVVGDQVITGLTTATTASTAGTVTDIRTGTIRGNTGFNSFGDFNVNAGNTVNLYVPTGASNLVNLVHNSQVVINGTLNGILNSGIGGNIIFADPHGLVVGAQGVINVGSLTVTTPSSAQMLQLAQIATGSGATDVAKDLQDGKYADGDGAVEINGKVNSAGSVNLFVASAVVAAGAQVNAGAKVFGATVNTAGAVDATAAVRKDGKIQIVADENVTFAGELAALMEQGQGGDVLVSAENLTLNDNAKLVSSGAAGTNSGKITLSGQRSVTLNGDAKVDSSASGAGKAGDVVIGAPSIKLNDRAQVLTKASGSGESGDINLRAASDLSFTGRNADGTEITTLDQLKTAVENQAKPLLAANLGKADVVIAKDAKLDASHATASKGGDITIEALGVDKQLGGYAEGSATIDVAGTLSGRNLSLRAVSEARVASDILGSLLDTAALKGDIAALKSAQGWTEEQTWSHIFDTLSGAVDSYERTTDLGLLMENPENFSELAALLPYISAAIAESDARITLGSSAVLNATGAIDLRAESTRYVDTSTWSIPILNGKLPFNAGLAYGRLGGETTVEVKSGAKLTAESLNILAHSDNHLAVSATAANTHDGNGNALTTMGFAFGMAHTDLTTTAKVADGAVLSIDKNVSLTALTEQTLSNEVSFKAIGQGASGGPAIALTLFNSKTLAAFDADLSGADNLNVTAANLVHEQSNSSTVQVGKNTMDFLKAKVLADPAVKGFIDGIAGKVKSFFGMDPKPGEAPKPTESKFRLASALAIGIADHEVEAVVGSGTSKPNLSLDGNLSVLALQEQSALHNSADSTVNANVDKGDGTKTAVSIAAVYSQLDQQTRALIGDGSSISAAHIGVAAQNTQTLDLGGLDRWSSLSAVFDNLVSVAGSLPELPGQLSTSYANSTSESEEFSLAGSLTVLNTNVDATAWVGDGVTLTATGGDSAWSSNPFETLAQLFDKDGEEDETRKGLRETEWKWTAPLSVQASNDIQQLAIAGNLWWSLFNNTSDGKAAGAGLNIQITDNDAIAGIGANGTLKAKRVEVGAAQDELIIGITPTAGKGASVAGNGSLVVSVVDSTVHASIHNSTAVEADQVGIDAEHRIGVWSAAGALAASNEAGIGASVAVNVLSSDVQALVGDNRQWRPDGWGTGAAGNGKGSWKVDEVLVKANSDGQNGAFSVAGAVAKTEKEKEDQAEATKTEGGADSGAQSLIERLGTTILQLAIGQAGMLDGLLAAKDAGTTIKDTVVSAPEKLQALWDKLSGALDKNSNPSGGTGTPVKLTFAAAGSGSINVSGQTTRARLGDIVLDPRDPAKGSKVTVLSLNQTNQLSGSGSGALTLSGGQKSERSSAIAGAVAYNHLYNVTEALLQGVTFNANDALKVQAASAGDQVAMGLGLAASTAGNENTAVALSGSVGVIMNTTRAAVENSTINQRADDSDGIAVTAYDRARVLLGGGAFAGSNGQGTSAGGSLVFGLLKNTLAAEWLGSSATHFDRLDVSANSAARILAGAVAGAISTGSNSKAGSGSLVAVVVDNDVKARIDKLDARNSSLSGGEVNVNAQSLSGLAALDGLFDSAGATALADTGLDLDGGDTTAQIDGKVSTDDDLFDAEGDAGTTSAHNLFTGELAGEAILAVAGNLAATSGKTAVGGAVSFVYTGSDYTASVANTGIDLSGDLNVIASNNTDVLAAAVGAAGAQNTAVSGSATAVIARGSVNASVDMTGQTLEADNLTVHAFKSGGSYSLAGNITGSANNASVGGAVSISDMQQGASAKVNGGSYTLTGDADIGAGLQSRIITAALSGQVSGSGSAVGGALTYNRIADTTSALLSNASMSARNLAISASQPGLGASIWSIAFNLSAAGGTAGVGAGVAVNLIDADRSAGLTGSTVNLSGKADLSSSLDGDIWGIGIDAAGGNTAGVGGSVVVNVIDGSDRVLIDDSTLTTSGSNQALSLDASAGSGLRIASLTGSITGGGTAAVGGAISVNRIGADRTALIRDSQISGFASAALKAGADQDIYAIAVAGGGAGTVAVNGSSTSNVLSGTERAAIEGGVLDVGSLNLSAAEGDRTIWSLAGAISGAGTVAVGVANANNIILAKRLAEVIDSDLTVAGALTVKSGGAAHIRSAAVGGGGAGTAAAGASIAVNVIEGEERALIDGSTVEAGSLAVEVTRGDADIKTLAGNVQGAGTGAGAGAVAVSTVNQKRIARIVDSSLDLGSGDARVEAATKATITTLALSGAGAGSVALAFSNTSNNIAAETRASVENSGGTAGTLKVLASDTSTIQAGSGGAAGAGAVAVGAATAINRVASEIEAALTGNLGSGWALTNLQLDAQSAAKITSAALAGGGSGTAAVMAVAATNIIQTQASAHIGDGARIVAQNNIGVSARNVDSILGTAAVGAVSGNASVSGIATVNLIETDTRAYIDGSTTQVSALGKNASDTLLIDSGALQNAPSDDRQWISAEQFNPVPNLSIAQHRITGLAVQASSVQQVGQLAVSVSVGVVPIAGAAVAGVANSTVLGGSTLGYIDGAKINQASGAGSAQNVRVGANSHSYSAGYLAAAALGASAAGVSGSVDATVISRQAQAYLRGTTLNSLGSTSVLAGSNQYVSTVIANIAGAIVGVGGSASLVILKGDTEALVDGGSKLNVGSLNVGASATQRLSPNAASGSGGAVAVSGALATLYNQSTTRAWVGTTPQAAAVTTANRTSVLGGGVNITASNQTKLLMNVASAGGGGAAVGGSVGIAVIETVTEAGASQADFGKSGSKLGSLSISASDDLDALSNVGSAQVGGVSVGGSANVLVANSAVRALFDRSSLVGSSFSLQALREGDIRLNTLTGSVGSSALGGSIGLLLLGTGATQVSAGDNAFNPLDELDKGGNGSLSQANALGNADKSGDIAYQDYQWNSTSGQYELVNRTDTGAKSSINASSKASLGDRFSAGGATTYKHETVARSSASSLVLDGAAQIKAEDRLQSSNLVGAVGLGGGAFGAAFALSLSNARVNAELLGGSLSAASLDLLAQAVDAGDKAQQVRALSGQGGFSVALGAGVAVGLMNNQVTSRLGGQLQTTGLLSAKAQDSQSQSVDADGAAIGGLGAAGLVLGVVQRTGSVQLTVDDGSALTANQISLLANALGSSRVEAIGAAGGLLAAGNASVAVGVDRRKVYARTGDDVVLTSSGSAPILLQAKATPQLSATAIGAVLGGGLGLGASVATVSAGADSDRLLVQASLGQRNRIKGSAGASVQATLATPSGQPGLDAKSYSGTGSLYYSANASVASAALYATVKAITGNGLVVEGGAFDLLANSASSQRAEALGVSVGGLLGVGAAVAEAGSDVDTRAQLGDAARLLGLTSDGIGDVRIQAVGEDRNIALSTSGSGGLIAGNAAVAKTWSRGLVDALLGNDAQLRVRNLDVLAQHRSVFGSRSSSINAALLGASGASSDNQADVDTRVSLGDDVLISSARDVQLRASNQFVSDHGGDAAAAAGGGVVSGQAAINETSLAGNSQVLIGQRSVVLAGVNPGDNATGKLYVRAESTLQADETVTLNTGGVLAGGGAENRHRAQLDNLVQISASAHLMSYGSLDLTTYTRANVTGDALANTWAGVGAAVAYSTVSLGSEQRLLVGSGALIEALGNINLTAGGDFASGWESSLLANANAQSSIRGLIAVPDAMAKGSVDSRSRVDLDSGSRVLGARNVVVGAYNGVTRTAVDGTARGYQLGFIPVTSHDSRSEIKRDSYATIDGQVLSGRYNELVINIDANGNLTQTSGLDVLSVFNASFNPTAYLNSLAGIDGTVSDVLAGTIASNATGAWLLGPMMAAGGDITINADRLDGSGTLRAQGGATIEVHNRSARYLVVGDALIPDQPGGNVLFTGGAGRDQAGSLSLQEINANRQPSILLESTYNGASGNSTYGPALFLAGDIHNYGGLLRIYNARGSVGQFGVTMAQQVLVEVPEGAMTVYTPYDYWSVGTNPWSQWKNYASLNFSANYAVQLIANAVYGSGLLANNNQGLLIQGPVYSDDGGSSIVLFGNCLVAVGGTDCSKATGDSFTGQSVRFRGIENVDSWLPVIPVLSLYKESAGYDNAVNSSSSRIVGGSVGIQAKYIDINATITSGAVTNRNVTIKADLSSWVEQINQICSSVSCNQLIDIPTYLLESTSGSSMIRAKYDRENQRVVMDDVNASGGGFVYLKGGIISTNPNGRIQVNNGSGQVQVQNLSAYDLQLGRIDTGAGSIGIVQIVDTLKAKVNGRDYTTWYVHDQSSGLSIYDNANGGTSIGTARLIGGSSGNSANYNPQAGLRYQWVMNRYLQRDWNGSELGNWYWTSDDWYMGTGTVINGAVGGPAYQQSITGSVGSWYNRGVNYHGCGDSNSCNWSFPRSGTYPEGHDRAGEGYAGWAYRYASSASIQVTQSVKADNPFAIQFIGNSVGRIDVNAGSGNDLLLGGKLNNPNGETLLRAGGDIRTLGTEGYSYSRDLSMIAGGSIGTGAQAFRAGLSSDSGVLSLAAGSGVNLQLDSAAVIQKVDGGSGDVTVAAFGNLLASQTLAANLAHVRGRNLSLSSQTGSVGALDAALRIVAEEVTGSNGGAQGGVVNVSANRDIALIELEGDFWVGRINSLTGDISLEARQGALLDAGLRLASSTIDAEQQEAFWRKLQLTAADGGEQRAIDLAVKPFEQQITASYREYWGLLELGDLQAGVLTLDAAGLARYRSVLEAQGMSGYTDAQVQAAAQSRFDALSSLFNQELGANWRGSQAFAAFDDGYRYQASEQQIARLTADALWSDGELRYAIDANALGSGSGTPVGVAQANVSGRNVQLRAAKSIGQLADSLQIDFADLRSGNLGAEQAAALAVATAPGDVTLVYGSDGSPQTVIVNQTVPFYVEAHGRLDVSAGASAFLQVSGDAHVGELSAGQDMRLAVAGSLLAASATSGKLTAGRDLILLAGVGSIGSQLQPLQLDVGGTLLAASAGEDINLRWTDGDFRLGRLFAGKDLFLDAIDGSLLSTLSGVALAAENIRLQARDNIGSASKALEVDLSNGNGVLSGTAGNAVYLHSAENLAIGELSAGGLIKLGSDADLMLGRLIHTGSVGGALFDLRAGGSILGRGTAAHLSASVAGSTHLSAGQSIGADTAPLLLDLPELTEAVAEQGDLYLETLSDVSGQRLVASHGDVRLHSRQQAGFERIEAGGDLRYSGGTLSVDTLLSGADMHLLGAADLLLGRAESGGALFIDAAGRVAADLLKSAALLQLDAQRAELLAVEAGADAELVADSADIGTLDVEGDVDLQVGELSLTALTATGDWTLTSTNATVGSAILGGDALLRVGSLNLGSLDADGDWTLSGTAAGSRAASAVVTSADIGGYVDLAVTDLDLGSLTGGGSLTLRGTDASIGSATLSGLVDMKLDGDLRQLTSLTSGGAWTLKAVNATVGTADIDGLVDMTLSGDLEIDNLTGGAAWNLSAVNATVGSAELADTADLVTSADLRLDKLVAKRTTLDLGSASHIGELQITGDLDLDVTGVLDLLKATVSGAADLHHNGVAGTALHYGTLSIDGTLNVSGAGDWAGDSAVVGQAVRFDVGSADLGSLESTHGQLSLQSTGLFAADELHSRAQYVDVLAGSTDLGNVSAADWLKVHSTGGTLRIGTGRSGTDLTLTTAVGSYADIHFGVLADASVPDVLVPSHLKAGRDLLVQTDGDVFGGNAEAENQLKIIGRNLFFGRAQSLKEDVFLQATGLVANGDGNITGLLVEAKRDVGIIANGDLTMPQVKYGGTYSLKAGRDLTVGVGGNLDLNGVAEAGRDLTFVIGGAVDLKAIKAGRHIKVESGQAINVDETVIAGGNILLSAANGDITVGQGIFSTGLPYESEVLHGNILLSASGNITTPDISAAAGSIEASGHHLDVNRLNASDDIALLAGGHIKVTDSISGGDQAWWADQDIGFDRLLAGGQVLLDSLLDTRGRQLRADQGALINAGWRNGQASDASIWLTQAEAPSLSLWAGNLIRVADASIGQRVDLHGQDIELYGRHTGSGQLNLWVEGSGATFAKRFDTTLQAENVLVPRFYVADSRVQISGDRIDILDARGVDRLGLYTRQATVLMDNATPAFQAAADVQLYELDKAFRLKQELLTTTTDAYVIHRKFTHQVLVPNFTEAHDQTVAGVLYQDTSAASYSTAQLSPALTLKRVESLLEAVRTAALKPQVPTWTPRWKDKPLDGRINTEEPARLVGNEEVQQWGI